MEITTVKIFLAHEERVQAYANITLDDCFVIRDIKVILGESGLFVAMPTRRRKDGTFKDIAHPMNSATRAKFERTILDAYEQALQAADVGA